MKRATGSVDGEAWHRYGLSRLWDENRPTLCWVMLNPSTADDLNDDPTIRKCVGFAKQWGYGRISVVNLFTFRATDPKHLKAAGYPTGDPSVTDLALRGAFDRASKVIVAWGANVKATGETADRAKEVLSMIHEAGHAPQALRITESGQPGHPLYIPYSTTLDFFEART